MKKINKKFKFFWTISAAILTVVFVVLKLTGIIAWAWVFVLLPAIIVGGCWVFLLLIWVIGTLIEMYIQE